MNQASTQENIPIAGVKDGIVILKDGQYRLVLEVSAINYSLKSEQEQNALIFQYQSFLNSLHFPIDITIQSKQLDLTPYLNKIKKLSKEQTNDLLKIQTEDYVDFISQLINIANIMKKTFYVTVGYQPLQVKTGLLDKLFNRNQSSTIRIAEDEFEHHVKELRQRASTVAQGLGSMGIHCRQLSTEEIIETFYNIYNPELAGKERLVSTDQLSSTMVTKKSNAGKPDQPEEQRTTSSIDNSAQVEAQQKKTYQEKQQEEEKEAERHAAQTKSEKKSPMQNQEVAEDKPKNNQQKVATDLINAGEVAADLSNINKPESAQSDIEKAEQETLKDPNLNKGFGA